MPDPIQQPIEAYLQRVAAQLGGRPERERRELLDALRRHIADALRSRSAQPTDADVEAVLATMDAPEDYADPPAAGDEGEAAAVPPRRGDSRWFLLALCFLALNGWIAWRVGHPVPAAGAPAVHRLPGVAFEAGGGEGISGRAPVRWKFDADAASPERIAKREEAIRVTFQPPTPGVFRWENARELVFVPATDWPACREFKAVAGAGWPGRTGDVFTFQSKPLRMTEVLQAGLSPERRVTLRLLFNAMPEGRLLEKHLKVLDGAGKALAYEFSGDAVSNSVLLETAPLLEGDHLKVVLAAGLPPASGTLACDVDVQAEVEIKEGLAFSGLRAESPSFEDAYLEASFSELIDVEHAERFVSVEPPVKFSIEPYDNWRGDGCLLRGGFAPGAVYTITFKAGLTSVNGQALTREVKRTVQMPDRPASLAIAAPGRYLSPAGSLRVPVSAMNVRAVTLSAQPILPQNLVQLVLREDGRYQNFYGSDSPDAQADLLTAAAAAHTVAVQRVLNREVRLAADLQALAPGAPSGAYLLSAEAEKVEAARQIVVVTDLGIAARRAHDGFLVWINSLREAAPRGGVAIQLFAENGSELARGRTADDGTVFLRPPAESGSDPILIVAQLGHDLSYLKLSTTELEKPEGGTKPYLAGAYEASVFTDRGIYRPGETIHARALVRDRHLGCPAPFPAVFRVVQPDGLVHRRFPVMLDTYAAAGADCELPTFVAPGLYRIELTVPGSDAVLGATQVSVEEFVPPQIRVQLEAPQGRQRAGEDVALRARADHLFGRPAAGLAATAGLDLEAAPFAPTNWPLYVFGDAEKSFARVQRQLPRATLDAEGRVVFTTPLGSDDLEPPAALRAVAGVTVIEGGGRAVTAYRSMAVDVYPFYIGLRRRDAGTVEVGATQRVSVITVTPDGAREAAPRPLRAVWSSVHHTTALKRGADGRYSFQTERTLQQVREQLINVGAEPVELAFAPPAAGEYVLMVDDPESSASSSLRYTAAARGDSWVSWSRERPDRVELEAERESYRPGDTARVTIKAPFAGTALLTVESDRIHQQRVLSLTGTTSVVDIPLRAEDAPNVYCTVTLLRPAVAEEVWTAHRAAGAVSLRVEPAGRRLTAGVTVPASARPGAPLEAVIRLVDEAGRPVAGDCVVAAVDEAICMLTDFETPDPMRDLLAPRFAGVTAFDLYSLLMPVWDDERGVGASSAPGDGGASLRRRMNPINARRFKPVALWQSDVHADSNGEARVRFDLPEFAGELRIMAVAWNKDRAGSGQVSVKVKRPLVAQSSLPRFLAPGDRSDATVQIFNETSNDVAGTLRITVGGPLRVDQPERTLKLAAGGQATERLALEASDAAGVGVVTIETSAGGESVRETIEIAVRPARAAEVSARVDRVAPGAESSFAPPTNWLAAAQTVRISGRPDVRLGRALEYLLRYPYGCLEQTVSASLPLLRLSELANGAIGREETQRFVQAGILRVLRMQRSDGLFSMWPGSGYRPQWTGLYATHFLVEAKRAGYDVPPERLAAALAALRERLATAGEPEADTAPWRNDLEERAYACHILALAGQPEPAWTTRLDELADRLPAGARAHLAAALLIAGEPRRARTLLAATALPDPADRLRGNIYRSGIRDSALLLLAWLDHDPAAPAAAALAQQLLAAQKEGHWGSTQEDAWSLVALGAYAARQQGQPTNFQAVVRIEGREIPVPASGLVLTNIGACVVRNEGPGDVYVLARSEGVPATGMAEELDAGLRVTREWLNLDGALLPDRTLNQGDLIVVKLTVDTLTEPLSDIVIEDLLPAGLEIENPGLAVSQQRPAWLKDRMDWCASRVARDDRMLVFSGAASGTHVFYYAARAVTPGRFVLPPVTATGMYEPSRRSVRGGGVVEVKR